MIEPFDDGFYGEVTIDDELVLGVNLMLGVDGQPVESSDEAAFFVCGDEEDGFFEIDLARMVCRPFVYH